MGGAKRSSGQWKLFAILAICVAPVIASYMMYYVVKPDGRTNYGELLTPQRPLDGLVVRGADGAVAELAALRGKWLMLTVDSDGCAQACADKLYAIRQVRLTTGKERDRIERVLLMTDATRPSPDLMQAHEGLEVFRVDPAGLERWFPVPAGQAPKEHIFIVDPLGNVMLRFPRMADPNRMKKDVSKLLRASRIG